MLVAVAVSSIKTRCPGSSEAWFSRQASRAAFTSGLFCSAACKVFFKGDIMTAEEPPQTRLAFLETMSIGQPGLDLRQRRVRFVLDECEQPVLMLLEGF